MKITRTALKEMIKENILSSTIINEATRTNYKFKTPIKTGWTDLYHYESEQYPDKDMTDSSGTLYVDWVLYLAMDDSGIDIDPIVINVSGELELYFETEETELYEFDAKDQKFKIINDLEINTSGGFRPQGIDIDFKRKEITIN